MAQRTWLITGVGSGFGNELAKQLLAQDHIVIGTVRRLDSVSELTEQYPETFHADLLDVTVTAAIRAVVDRWFGGWGASMWS
jgi:NADP-dependent 3-hydroxy acid dehydrogenase YdfG